MTVSVRRAGVLATILVAGLAAFPASSAAARPAAPKPHVTYSVTADCARTHGHKLFDDVVIKADATGLVPSAEYYAGISFSGPEEGYNQDGTAYGFTDANGALHIRQTVSDGYGFRGWKIRRDQFFQLGRNVGNGGDVVEDSVRIARRDCSADDLITPARPAKDGLVTRFTPQCVGRHSAKTYLRMHVTASQAHQPRGSLVALTFSAYRSHAKYYNGLRSLVRRNGLLYISQNHWLYDGAELQAGRTYYWEIDVYPRAGGDPAVHTGTFTLPANACD